MFDEYNLYGMFNGETLDIFTIIERLKEKGIKDLKYVTVEGAELPDGEFRHQISLWRDKPRFHQVTMSWGGKDSESWLGAIADEALPDVIVSKDDSKNIVNMRMLRRSDVEED